MISRLGSASFAAAAPAASHAAPAALRLFSSEGKQAAGEVIKEAAKEFKKDGAVGSQFEATGGIGGTVQEMADKGALPKTFSKDGAIGHQFTSEGKVGGTVERIAEKEEQVGEKIAQQGREGGGGGASVASQMTSGAMEADRARGGGSSASESTPASDTPGQGMSRDGYGNYGGDGKTN